MYKNLAIFAFGLLLGYFIFSRGNCNLDFSTTKYDTISAKIDTLYQRYDSTVYKKGKDIYHDTTIYVELPVEVLQQVDTAAILKEYFAINVYKDTLRLQDSLGYITITDSISKNALVNRLWFYDVKKTIITKEVVLREKPKTHIYAGVAMNGFANSAEANLFLQNKKGKILQLGVVRDFNTNENMGKLGLIWKLK